MEALTPSQPSIRKHWLQPSAQCGNIDANTARNVETLTPPQRTMWNHWHQLSAQSGNVDMISSEGSRGFWDYWLIFVKPGYKSKFGLFTSYKMILLLRISKTLLPLLGPFKIAYWWTLTSYDIVNWWTLLSFKIVIGRRCPVLRSSIGGRCLVWGSSIGGRWSIFGYI